MKHTHYHVSRLNYFGRREFLMDKATFRPIIFDKEHASREVAYQNLLDPDSLYQLATCVDERCMAKVS